MSAKLVTAQGTHNGLPAIMPGPTSLKVAIGGSSAQSAAIQSQLVRVVSTSDCHIAIGTNPTAAADGTCVFLPASIPEYFVLLPGSKLAVIQDSAPGTLFITPAV